MPNNKEFLAGSLYAIQVAKGFGDIAAAVEATNYRGELSTLFREPWLRAKQNAAIRAIVQALSVPRRLDNIIIENQSVFVPWCRIDLTPLPRGGPLSAHGLIHLLTYRLCSHLKRCLQCIDAPEAKVFLTEKDNEDERRIICIPPERFVPALVGRFTIVATADDLPQGADGRFSAIRWSESLADELGSFATHVLGQSDNGQSLQALQSLLERELRGWMMEYIPANQRQNLLEEASPIAGVKPSLSLKFEPANSEDSTVPKKQSRNPGRDAYVVKRKSEDATYSEIMIEVNANPDWRPLKTRQAVQQVLNRMGETT